MAVDATFSAGTFPEPAVDRLLYRMEEVLADLDMGRTGRGVGGREGGRGRERERGGGTERGRGRQRKKSMAKERGKQKR